ENADTKEMMAQMHAAIDGATRGEEISVVLLTGDLVSSGKEHEYRTVERLLLVPLKTLESTKHAKIVSVPGNHDLDCDEGLPLTWNSLGPERQKALFRMDDRGKRLRASRAKAFAAY